MRLSSEQARYLKHASFLPTHLARIIQATKPGTYGTMSLSIHRPIAEEFRDAFTLRLAEVGFDARHELTSEGRMLEDLIDLFFVVE